MKTIISKITNELNFHVKMAGVVVGGALMVINRGFSKIKKIVRKERVY